MSKQKIVEMLAAGAKPAEISKTLRVSRSYIHRIKRMVVPAPQVVLRKDLPWHILKAAEKWDANLAPNTPMVKALCLGCKRDMYTRDAKLEDICEECAYAMMEEVVQGQTKAMQQAQVCFDPFVGNADFGTPGKAPNPFRTLEDF